MNKEELIKWLNEKNIQIISDTKFEASKLKKKDSNQILTLMQGATMTIDMIKTEILSGRFDIKEEIENQKDRK